MGGVKCVVHHCGQTHQDSSGSWVIPRAIATTMVGPAKFPPVPAASARVCCIITDFMDTAEIIGQCIQCKPTFRVDIGHADRLCVLNQVRESPGQLHGLLLSTAPSNGTERGERERDCYDVQGKVKESVV